jgi:hypothetical protein
METDGDMTAVSKGKKPGKKRRNRAGAVAGRRAGLRTGGEVRTASQKNLAGN